MYFAVNFPREFSPDGAAALTDELDAPLEVSHSQDGELLAVLRSSVLHVWSCHPLTLLTSYTRSAKSIEQHGSNALLQWSSDSDAIAVATTAGVLLVFQLESAGVVNELSCSNAASTSYAAVRNAVQFDGPAVAYKPSTGWAGNKITAITGCRDSVLVATAAGAVERFSWKTHTFDATQTIVLQDILFPESDSAAIHPEVHVVRMDYHPSLRALAVVLSTGAAACILGETATLSVDKGLRGLWAVRSSTDGDGQGKNGTTRSPRACCVALNARFKLLAVGHDDGEVAMYTIEEHTSLARSHTVKPPQPPGGRRGGAVGAGAVTVVQFSADGYCVAVGWKRGGVGTWSVFGARLMSLADLDGDSAMAGHESDGVTSLSWGPEGYALSTTLAKRSVAVQYQFVKSAMTSNSTLANQLNVVLQGEDRICVSGDMGDVRFERGVDKLCDLQWQTIQIPDSYLWANWPIRYVAVDNMGQSIAVAGSHGVAHYSVASRKWRLFGNESQERTLCCTGGLAWWQDLLVVPCRTPDGKFEVRFYPRDANLDNRNVVHTIPFGREILYLNVCGDRLIVYTASRRIHVYRIVPHKPVPKPTGIGAALSVGSLAMAHLGSASGIGSALSVSSLSMGHRGSFGDSISDTPPVTPTKMSELTPTPRSERLNSISSVQSSVQGDVFREELRFAESPRSFAAAAAATFSAAASAAGSPRMARSRLGKPPNSGLMSVDLEWELSLKDEANHSSQVISLALVYGTLTGYPVENPNEPRGLIANISGHLLLFSHETAPECGVSLSSDPDESGEEKSFGPPALLATGVENFWMRSPSDTVRLDRSLDDALWLGCGAFGMKVWLPLYPSGGPDRALPKRVMLPFKLDIYPLSVLTADAVVLGAAHESFGYRGKERPFFAVARKTQPYLHHILRQLLRRNEDEQARRIAEACSHLAYFPHVLELMLHKVLEDERNAHEGESDVQLPRASRFLEGFPFFLETVVHCARKTDVAKWSKLFAATGPAEELFERCIVTGQLHTASSYLLVLQSLQSPAASQQHALRILRLALDGENWDLARDLIRFLQATSGYVPITDHELELAKQVEVSGQKDSFHAALRDHALGVLESHRLRALGEFVARLHFPLLRWLESVRSKKGRSLDGVPALNQALVDFGAREGSKLSCCEEAVYFMNMMFAARFFDWAFLLALLLLDDLGAARILEEVALDPESADGVFGLLKRFKLVVADERLTEKHRAFYSRLTSSFRSAAPFATDLERERPESPDAGTCVMM
eukprot:m.103023 g.103023  ORF g.103023 m.103023 type:complete len:1266 (+) comp20854_c0_seq1:272-4069(+)